MMLHTHNTLRNPMIPLTKTQQIMRFARFALTGAAALVIAATIYRIWQLPL